MYYGDIVTGGSVTRMLISPVDRCHVALGLCCSAVARLFKAGKTHSRCILSTFHFFFSVPLGGSSGAMTLCVGHQISRVTSSDTNTKNANAPPTSFFRLFDGGRRRSLTSEALRCGETAFGAVVFNINSLNLLPYLATNNCVHSVTLFMFCLFDARETTISK